MSIIQITIKIKDINYFDFIATAAAKEIDIYNNVYEFVNRLEIYV